MPPAETPAISGTVAPNRRTVDEAYVADMERTAAFLEGAGRIKSRTHVLDYTYTDPLAEADAALVQVKGRWKP